VLHTQHFVYYTKRVPSYRAQFLVPAAQLACALPLQRPTTTKKYINTTVRRNIIITAAFLRVHVQERKRMRRNGFFLRPTTNFSFFSSLRERQVHDHRRHVIQVSVHADYGRKKIARLANRYAYLLSYLHHNCIKQTIYIYIYRLAANCKD